MTELIALIFALGFFAVFSIIAGAIMQIRDELRNIARVLQSEEPKDD